MKWNKFVSVVIVIVSVFLCANILTAEEIRITNGEWAPFVSKKLPHYGLTSHIVTEAYAKVGIKVKYGFFPWARVIDYVKRGEWDSTLPWIRNEEREQIFHFSVPILAQEEVLFHLKNRPFPWSTLECLMLAEGSANVNILCTPCNNVPMFTFPCQRFAYVVTNIDA